jgi:hypothetical protein
VQYKVISAVEADNKNRYNRKAGVSFVLLCDPFLFHNVSPSTHPPEADKQRNIKEVAIAGCFSCRKKSRSNCQALATLKDWIQKINVALAVERNGVSLNWQESVG